MAEQFKNLASTTLNGAIDDSTTTITVASAMGFTGGNFRILIDSEIMKVTAVSGLDLTVARGQEGTSPTAHANAAVVRHVLTVGALDAHDQDDLAAYAAFASKPAAGVPGRIFLPTDGIFFERDNGSAWEKFGPLWPMTPPQASDFPTWVNQGTATITDNKGAVWMYAPYTSSLQIRMRVKDYPTPPFTVEAAFVGNTLPNAGSGLGGIGIRDSSSGKLQLYGAHASYMELYGYSYSSPTAAASAVTGWPSSGQFHLPESDLFWVKYEDDNTNRKISFSVDGYTWTQIVSVSRTEYLTPNQIGLWVNSYPGGGSSGYVDTGVTFLHWKQS
jgi:hypothetical protein